MEPERGLPPSFPISHLPPFLTPLQQRSLGKKVGSGQWDLSVAEHLQPGEIYSEGAVRGLQEELGIDAEAVRGQGSGTVRGWLGRNHEGMVRGLQEKLGIDAEAVRGPGVGTVRGRYIGRVAVPRGGCCTCTAGLQ